MRILALLAAIVAGAVAFAAPAFAAPLGTVAIGQPSGTVTDTPMFAMANTSGACPPGFGANALIRIGRPDGPFTNLARPMTAGGYDRVPVVARPDRSFETALGQRPGDGAWLVVVECFSPDAGRAAERFATAVTVTGTAWRVGGPDPAAGPASPGPSQSNTTPGAAPGAASASGNEPRHGTDTRATGSRRDAGSGPMGVEVLIGAAVVLAALAIGGVLLARRRTRKPTTNRRSLAGSSSGRS